jgi:hypothetical protein
MAFVKYLGPSHFRELGAADFKKFGVGTQKKVTFTRDEPTQIHDDAAYALLENLPDEFEVVDEDDSTAQTELMTDSVNPDEVDHPAGHLPEEG